MTAPLRVLMIVANDISHDTRVLKSALALADGGAQVSILGVSSKGTREESTLGPVRILRVPVAFHRRDAQALAVKERRLQVAVAPEQRRAALESARATEVEAALSGLAGDRRRALLARARTSTHRARAIADSGVNRVLAKGRAATSKVMRKQPIAVSWRSELPAMLDYADALGPVIDGLDWDVIHAHDVHFVGVAARAVERRRAQGRRADWVYDAHEYVAGLSEYTSRPRRVIAAYSSLEQEFIQRAAGVITVSPPLADVLQARYRLDEVPAVVMNSPVLDAAASPVKRDVRDVCGLGAEVPLLVYSGGVNPARGIPTAVAALPSLPGVHLAVVCVPGTHTSPVARLRTQAAALKVADRVHFVEPVRPEEVSAFLAGADIGLLPFLHFGSHEVALANKLFEYLFAGVPVLASDCRAQAEFISRHEVGEVFTAGSASGLAEKARLMLARRAHYRTVIAEQPDLLSPYAWEVQERALRTAYRHWFGESALDEPETSTAVDGLTETPVVRLGIDGACVAFGPANLGGLGWRWAKALEVAVPGLRTEVLCLDRAMGGAFPADVSVAHERASEPSWAGPFGNAALERWTHVVVEFGGCMLGPLEGGSVQGQAKIMRDNGIRVVSIVHEGQRVDPSMIGDADCDALLVATPELSLELPDAQWLPVVVDPEKWSTGAEVFASNGPPVVLYSGDHWPAKAVEAVREELQPLHDEGLIDLRTADSLSPATVALADLVIGTMGEGGYTQAMIEALMAGRLVVGNISQEVRDICPLPLPVLQATTGSLGEVVRAAVADPASSRARSAAGREYAMAIHDGRRSGAVLASSLNL